MIEKNLMRSPQEQQKEQIEEDQQQQQRYECQEKQLLVPQSSVKNQSTTV